MEYVGCCTALPDPSLVVVERRTMGRRICRWICILKWRANCGFLLQLLGTAAVAGLRDYMEIEVWEVSAMHWKQVSA